MRGGNAMAIAFNLSGAATLNDVDQQARPADVLSRIAHRKINRVDELLPWNCIAE